MLERKQYTTDLKEAEWNMLKPYLLRLMPEQLRGRKTSYRPGLPHWHVATRQQDEVDGRCGSWQIRP